MKKKWLLKIWQVGMIILLNILLIVFANAYGAAQGSGASYSAEEIVTGLFTGFR